MGSAGEPMIEGERASLLLAAVLSLRIQGKHDGTVRLAGHGDPRAMAALARAVDRVETRMRTLRGAHLVTIVAQRAMEAYGMTVAPWQYQLSDAS